MKSILSSLLAATLILGFVGCTSTPSRQAYNVVAVPAVTVDHVMAGWGDYVAKYAPSADEERQVKAAYEKYQVAEIMAIDAAQAYATLAASGATNAIDLAASLVNNQNASQAASQALADLVKLVESFGVKL